jgi:hypothetical protein
MKLPPLIPSLEQALEDIRPIIGRLIAAFDHATGEARATAEEREYDGSYFSHQVRFEAKMELKGSGIEAEDCELEDTPNTGICIAHPGYSIRVLRSQDGEIPDPGDSDRRKRFLEQQSEQLNLFQEDQTPGHSPEREPTHLVMLWETVGRFFSGFWLICPDGVGRQHFKHWLPRPEFGIGNAPNPPLPPPDTLEGIQPRRNAGRKTGSTDVSIKK